MDYLLITRADNRLTVLQFSSIFADVPGELEKWSSTADPSWLPVQKTRVATNPVFPASDPDAWVDDGTNIVISASLKTTVDAATQAALQSAAVNLLIDAGPIGRLERAAVLIMRERINAIDKVLNDLFAAIASATSLANLQTRAAVVAATVPPQYSIPDINTAVNNKINSPEAN